MVDCLYAPLINFILRINFAEIENPIIETLTEISRKLSTEGYSEPIRIKLNSSKGPDPQFIFAPVRFLSEEEGNEISIFRDSIYFQYKKYSRWDQILPKILSNFFYLAEKLKILLIKKVSLDYIDLFTNFPQNRFELKSYFNISIKYSSEFDIDYEDFIIGVKLNIEELDHKSILRIRGLKPSNEEFYKIQLETHYEIMKEIEINEREQFQSNLNYAHDILLKYFKQVLSERTKRMIVMDNGTNS